MKPSRDSSNRRITRDPTSQRKHLQLNKLRPHHTRATAAATIEEIYYQKDAHTTVKSTELVMNSKEDSIFNPGPSFQNMGLIRDMIGLDYSWNAYGGASVARNSASVARYRLMKGPRKNKL